MKRSSIRVGANPTLNCLELHNLSVRIKNATAKKKRENKLNNIENKVNELIEDTIINLGYSLYDVQYVKEGKDYFLRLFLESENGIDLEDCEKVSNSVTDILDKEDYIKEQYFLEVSSTRSRKDIKKR